jgi:signal transduction histidine kinase
MNATGLQQMEHNIARCRVVLSIAAILVVYIDPEEPLLARWIPFVYGAFRMDPRLFVAMAGYVAYSVMVYLGLGRVFPERVATFTTWADVAFAVAIGTMTEGVTGPSYPFFAFAAVSSGLRGGLHQAMTVTTASLVLYLCLIMVSSRGDADVYIMRPVYLAITGYVVGYLGQQRLELQEQMRQLEVAEQRHRIARELHDGYAQALAGINLRLEGSRRLLRADAAQEALSELTELQESVKHEFDDLRRYARTLAGVEVTPTSGDDDPATQLRMSAEMSGSVDRVEHILGIAREGISNVRRHARARHAQIDIRADTSHVRITIEDDGVGFRSDVTPWSIASRVKEMGGELRVVADQRPGAHLLITLPPG